MILTYWWIPLVVLIYSFQGFLTFKTNTVKDSDFWYRFYILFTMIPLWPVVCKYSKDVVFHAILFDVLLMISYAISLLYFTQSFSKFNNMHWISVLLIVFGLVLFKKAG